MHSKWKIVKKLKTGFAIIFSLKIVASILAAKTKGKRPDPKKWTGYRKKNCAPRSRRKKRKLSGRNFARMIDKSRFPSLKRAITRSVRACGRGSREMQLIFKRATADVTPDVRWLRNESNKSRVLSLASRIYFSICIPRVVLLAIYSLSL